MIFELFPKNNHFLFLLAPELTDSPHYFVWNLCWRLTLIYWISDKIHEHKDLDFDAVSAFLAITWFDLLDYALTGNSLYWGYDWLSSNTVCCFGYCSYVGLRAKYYFGTVIAL